MRLEDFEDLVNQSLLELPTEFRRELNNVGLVVEPWPNRDDLSQIKAHANTLLFGLYKGIPKNKRTSSYSSLPDKITIYAGPILMVSRDYADLRRRVKETVYHEIGHHFGLTEDQIQKAQTGLHS